MDTLDSHLEGGSGQVSVWFGPVHGLPFCTPVAHTNGWQDHVCHDAALVRPAGRDPVVLVVLATTDLDNAAANALTARIAAACWEEQP